MSSGVETHRPATPDADPTAARSSSRRLGRILVATDGSPVSADAVALAFDLAAEHGSELVFVHVVPLLDVAPPEAIDDVGNAFVHVPTAHDHELERAAAATATERGVVATTVLLPGSPAPAIVAHSESCDADLIVVGSHGRGAVASALLGSVSLGVLQASKRSVLVVRAQHRPR
jgi:nucleotide-binding universal stress UspA family protein